MNNDKLSRRTFIRNTSLAAAGTIGGALGGQGCAKGQEISKSGCLIATAPTKSTI